MTYAEAKQLKKGDRVEFSDMTGAVLYADEYRVEIQWDDRDFSVTHPYDMADFNRAVEFEPFDREDRRNIVTGEEDA